MKRKVIGIIFLISIFLSGCGTQNNFDENKTESVIQNSEFDFFAFVNESVPIYDKNNHEIGSIEHYGPISQTDDSIIYTRIPDGKTNNLTEMDYYRFNLITKENTKLVTIKNWAYEAFYDTIFYDNHLYLLITTGDINNLENSKLSLYDIDLKSNGKTSFELENGGNPYSSMALSGNKIIIARPGKSNCFIDEYDLKTKQLSNLLTFRFDSITNTGETIRHVASDEKGIYLLRLKIGQSTQLYIDFYNSQMNYIKSIDISEMITNKNADEIEKTELRQLVAHFSVVNQYIYYENFSSSRALGKIQNNKFEQFLETDSTFAVAKEISPVTKTSLYYKCYDPENLIYLVDTEKNSLGQSSFFSKDKKYYITFMTKNTDNELLIFMNYKDPNTGEVYPPKIYYITLSDLKFIYN